MNTIHGLDTVMPTPATLVLGVAYRVAFPAPFDDVVNDRTADVQVSLSDDEIEAVDVHGRTAVVLLIDRGLPDFGASLPNGKSVAFVINVFVHPDVVEEIASRIKQSHVLRA